MKYLLDTNTVSYYLRGDEPVANKMRKTPPQDIAISAVTAMELVYGAHRRNSKKISRWVDRFIEEVTVIPFEIGAAQEAGVIRSQLAAKGIALSFPDSQIAGHAKALKMTLVTSDSDFDAVTKLKTVDWKQG